MELCIAHCCSLLPPASYARLYALPSGYLSVRVKKYAAAASSEATYDEATSGGYLDVNPRDTYDIATNAPSALYDEVGIQGPRAAVAGAAVTGAAATYDRSGAYGAADGYGHQPQSKKRPSYQLAGAAQDAARVVYDVPTHLRGVDAQSSDEEELGF